MMGKIKLLKTNCKVCGNELYTTNKSLAEIESFKSKYVLKCKNCVSENEQHEILDLISIHIINKGA
jgi:Zn-finger protein